MKGKKGKKQRCRIDGAGAPDLVLRSSSPVVHNMVVTFTLELEAVCLRLAVVWGETMSQAPVGKKQSKRLPLRKKTATAGSDVVQSGRPIFDDFFQHLWPYISNNTANVVFQMVKRLWLIRIDQ
ncbi:hypothetical protein TNCV_1135271 [Trichonephila clavipes]|nr:hypothetical protein TNCV_1135271 [Trichonephila clavipes]